MIDISIVVPIYKIKLNYLKECLNSCINQTMRNIEIICIIDGHDAKIKQSVVKKVNKEFIITNFFRPDYAKLNLNFNSPWAKLYSKKFLDENNLYFNEKFKYGEDLLFNFAVIQSTERIGIVKKYDYNYRIRKDAITSSSLEKII